MTGVVYLGMGKNINLIKNQPRFFSRQRSKHIVKILLHKVSQTKAGVGSYFARSMLLHTVYPQFSGRFSFESVIPRKSYKMKRNVLKRIGNIRASSCHQFIRDGTNFASFICTNTFNVMLRAILFTILQVRRVPIVTSHAWISPQFFFAVYGFFTSRISMFERQ